MKFIYFSILFMLLGFSLLGCPSTGEGDDTASDTTSDENDTDDSETEDTTGNSDTTDSETEDAGCELGILNASISDGMGTVGIVEWSPGGAAPASAEIVFSLVGADGDLLNTGGVAPVNLETPNYRTLLLGLKQQRTYSFVVKATLADGALCESEAHEITTTSLPDVPLITRDAVNPSAQEVGFLLTCGGVDSTMPAVIIDADGDIVWAAPAPTDCSRIRMDWEGDSVWMISTNALNNGGEMRRVSMDGTDLQNNVDGLSSTHHDFTVLPEGVVAAFSWSDSGWDVESDLLLRAPDGSITTAFHVGSNLYPGGTSVFGMSNSYHANSINYYPSDDSFMIADRNPAVIVKVTTSGQAVWQLGGDCAATSAPACTSGTWDVCHGNHLLENGNVILFSNGAFMSSEASQALEFSLDLAGGSLSATQVHSYTSSTNAHSDSLGNVQRLPNGNTLVVFSNAGRIEELSPSWEVVQSLTTDSFGYADWRETLWGPPAR